MKKASAWAFFSLLIVFSAPAHASTSTETLLAIAINGEEVSVPFGLLGEVAVAEDLGSGRLCGGGDGEDSEGERADQSTETGQVGPRKLGY